jgi:hypothetical protein
MADETPEGSLAAKELGTEVSTQRSPTIDEERGRRPSEFGPRILFAPDPRERARRSEEIAVLPLSRTFSRQSKFSSYSAKSDDETERVKRVTTRKTVEPHTRLPTCMALCALLM